MKDKTIAFLPITLGRAASGRMGPRDEDGGRLARHEICRARSQFDNPAQQQALTALVNDKPDVLIVQNPSVTLLIKELKRAESQGTHVIQINMASNYKSDAFVGADWHEVGRMLADEVVKQCGTGSGKSGKVQIVQGELTAAASVDQVGAMLDVFSKDKNIKVVSNQAANWDANTALNITATVIQQHPDLCASVGFWGIMESGAAQAIRNAGKIDQVKVYASGEGSQLDCDQINQGNFTKFLNYKSTEQGHDLVAAAVTLLEGRREGRDPASGIFHDAGLGRQDQCQRRQLLRITQGEVTRPLDYRDPVSERMAGAIRVDGVGPMSMTTLDTNSFSERLRASYSPRLLLSELLMKQWFEPVIPFTRDDRAAGCISPPTIPDYASFDNLLSLMRLFAEFGFVALGDGLLPDLPAASISVSAPIFALCNFAALFFLFVMGWPVWAASPATLAVGVAIGGINGLLIGYIKARPFLTTLVTLIILRASVNILNEQYRHRLRHQFGRQRRLGLPRRRLCARHSDQRRGPDRGAARRSSLPQPLALRLASHRDRREPQGGAPCRHPGRAHAVRHLRAVGHALRRRRHLLCRATGQHRFHDRRRLGIPGADRGGAGRRLARRRQGHGLARHDRRHHHLRC